MSTNPITSPNTSTDTFQLQLPPPFPIDNDTDNRGVHCSVSNPDPQASRRTSVQSVPGTMMDGDWTTSVVNPVNAQDRQASSTTSVQIVGKALSKLFKPERKVGKAPGLTHELKIILFSSWLNVFLLSIPISWALQFAEPREYTLVFIFSFVGIIPLSKLLEFATDELSIRVGEALAELINTTLGNAVELIVAIFALVKCELRIVQSSLVGSILSNLLLVLGLCFFAGGTRFSEQGFALGATQIDSSLLALSVTSVLLPAAFNMVAGHDQTSELDNETEQRDILKLSRGIAIVLLFTYYSYLVFQLFSHRRLYNDKNAHKPETVKYSSRTRSSSMADSQNSPGLSATNMEIERNDPTESDDGEDGEQVPQLSLPLALGLLVVVIVLIGVTAGGLVQSVDGLASHSRISKEFIGFILLPTVGNVPEFFAAVTVSIKDKLTSGLVSTVGRSVQISLFVIPLIVVLGWMIDRPITMLFDSLECIALFFSVSIINYVVQNGRSNWLDGMILICSYVIVALVFYFYPGTPLDGLLKVCPA